MDDNLRNTLHDNLQFPQRELIALRIEHADLDATIYLLTDQIPIDELLLRRLKKRSLALRDRIQHLDDSLNPPEPA